MAPPPKAAAPASAAAGGAAASASGGSGGGSGAGTGDVGEGLNVLVVGSGGGATAYAVMAQLRAHGVPLRRMASVELDPILVSMSVRHPVGPVFHHHDLFDPRVDVLEMDMLVCVWAGVRAWVCVFGVPASVAA